MKRALLISVQGIGNTVLATPAIRLLAEAGYQTDLIVSDNSSHKILSASPYVNQRYLWKERDGWVKNVLRLRTELRSVKYETACALYPNGRRENVLLYFAKASHKKCYVDPKRYYRMLGFLPVDEKVVLQKHHDAISNINLVQIDPTKTSSHKPETSLSREAVEFAEQYYESHGLIDKFVVAIHPGGTNSAKQWSGQGYRELCKKLVREHDVKILIFGSDAESHLVEGIAQDLKDEATSICGLNINQVAAILRRSQLVIANDSALIHIASTFDIPVVAIWGYTDFYRTAPFNDKAVLIRIDYPCSPCYDFATGYITDCEFHLKCIRNISIDNVYPVVNRCMSLLNSHQAFEARAFEEERGVQSVQRIEGGCLMVNLVA